MSTDALDIFFTSSPGHPPRRGAAGDKPKRTVSGAYATNQAELFYYPDRAQPRPVNPAPDQAEAAGDEPRPNPGPSPESRKPNLYELRAEAQRFVAANETKAQLIIKDWLAMP